MKSIIDYINEVNGWTLENDDWQFVNNESDGKDLYAVKLWWGSGYLLDCYAAYANDPEDALNYVVAYIEENSPKLLKITDSDASDMLKDIENGDASEDDFDEIFLYVDSPNAKRTHYLYSENIFIDKFPKNKMPKNNEKNS